MNKQYKPNIVRGGVAIPLGNNYFFMKGRKHKQGGIDVGKDLEVEDGEIMKLTKDNIKVFSAVPFLNGQSPVEKLLGGENPNKVFAEQERFKKVNKINDDGTKAQLGKGKKITTTEIPESQQYAVTTPDGQRKVFNSKQEASDYVTVNTPKGYSLYDTTNYGTNIDKGQTAILNRNTEREIEKATKQEELAKTRLATIQQNKEASKEMLSYMPVIGDGMDLYQLGKDIYNKQYGNAAITAAALTMPAWADVLVKPIGKAVKRGYGKIKNILNTNNNFIDYTLNKNFKTNDIDLLTPQDEFTQYILFGNDNPNEIIKDYEYGKKHYFDIIDQLNYESELRKRSYSEDNAPRINKHIKPFKELNLGERYKLLPEVEDLYYREHFNDDKYVKDYDKIMDYIDASYIDENTLLKSSSDIDEKNIGLIGDHLWDDLYYKAITDNNLEEVQKLSDLHFKQKAVNNKSNRLQYHGIARGYDPNFTIFNPKENHASIFTSDDLNTSTSYVTDFVTLNEVEKGMEMFKNKMEDDLNDYLLYAKQNPNSKFSNTKDIEQAEANLKKLKQMSKDELRKLTLEKNPYSPNRIKKLYTYLKNPIIFDNKGNQWSDIDINNLPENIQNLIHRNNENIYKTLNTEDIENISRKYGYDGVIANNVLDFGSGFYKIIDRNKPSQIVITNDPRKIKLADPITYDDNGKIIPLSKRHDFTNRDMRYSWLLPTIGATTGLSLINNNDQNVKRFGGRTKAPLGVLKKIGQKLGLIEDDKKTYANDIHWGIKQDIKNGKIHIGGKPNEARQKYFDLDKEFSDSVKAVSKRYGLNPNLVASRIAKEGPIDYGIELVNDSVGFNREQMDGAFWGLDDLGTHIEEGRVTIKEPWNRIKSNRYFTNEKGRDTNSVYSTEWVDGIYGTAAELKYRRDYMKKHFPDMTDEQLDAAAAASFNRGNYGARKWINNKGNYMQYKPFIKLKQMGGNHKLNTNQMANIYRVDSNGKTTWGMNFSTGDKSKSRQKAELGLKTKNDGSYYGYPKKDNKGNTWYIPTDEDLKLMYPGLAEDVDYNTLSDYDKKRYDEREGVREGYRVLPTGGIFYSDKETIFVNDEMDVNRIITKKTKQPRKYYISAVDPNIDPLNPTKDDYHYMAYGKRNDKDNVKPGPTFNNTVDARDVNREIPKTYVSTKSNSTKSNKTNVVTPNTIKSTTNNKSVNYNVTNKKQTTPKQTTPVVSATTTTSKSNVTNNPINITTPNNVTRTTPIAKSSSQEIPIFGLDAQNAFKKSIVGSKANPDYIRGTFDFRDSKELVNKINPSTIKVNPTDIRYKGTPSSGGYFKNYNAGDYISLGANVLGNIGSALINKHTLDNMEYTSAPVPKMAIKQKTNFNINPQLDHNREILHQGISDIDTNTSSSNVGLNRKNQLRLANIMNTNKLYSTKENVETQLINADRMNQQNVFNSNIDAFNTWNKEKNIFETAKQEKYGENKVGAVQGISQAVHDFINNNEKRRQFNNSLISIMAANPNVNPEYLKALGADWITDKHIRNWKLANNYKV